MAIVARNVSKRFGDFVALDDVSVEAPAGSLVALLGPSGSGKSTLLRVIAGLENPDSGEIIISNEDKTRTPPQKCGVGFVFQHYAAFKHMTVFDNVAFGLRIRKRKWAEIEKRVHDLLGLVQLDGFSHRYPTQLSGGQR
jgi:sulfate transport system ATP-binding protein